MYRDLWPNQNSLLTTIFIIFLAAAGGAWALALLLHPISHHNCLTVKMMRIARFITHRFHSPRTNCKIAKEDEDAFIASVNGTFDNIMKEFKVGVVNQRQDWSLSATHNCLIVKI